MGRYDKYVKPKPEKEQAGPTVEKANRYASFKPETPPKPPEPTWLEGAGNFGLDVLRNFNDTLTFGLYPKAVDAISGNNDQQQLLEQSNGAAQIIGDTAGYVLPGLGMSTAVAKAVPRLAANTIPATIGREAISSGALSATDDLIRTGSVDPAGVATDAALGGATAGLFSGLGRIISPEARIRARGNKLSDATKLTAETEMRNAARLGIDLNVPEGLAAANPAESIPIKRMYDDALQAPQGSEAAQVFEATRGPKIEDIGRQMVDSIGPGASPFDVSAAAEAAITRNRETVQNTVKPIYDKAAVRKAPPTWLSKLSNQPGYRTAYDDVLNDTDLMMELTQEWGRLGGRGNLENSTLMQDAVKKRLDEMAGQSFDQGRNMKGGIFSRASEATRGTMDRVSTDYSTARMLAAEGNQRVSNLEAGPLGQVTDTPSAKGQSSIMFGVDNAVDAGLSKEALDQLAMQDPALPRGVLANNLDSALSADPSNWANAALPSPHAKGIAMGIAPDVISDARFRAASMVNPSKSNALPGHDGTWFGKIQAGALNAVTRKGKVAKLLQDPDTVPKLGRMGPVQKVVNQAGVGTVVQARKRRAKKRRRPPLEILVDYDGKP